MARQAGVVGAPPLLDPALSDRARKIMGFVGDSPGWPTQGLAISTVPPTRTQHVLCTHGARKA